VAPNTKPLERKKPATQAPHCSAAELPPVAYTRFYQRKLQMFSGVTVKWHPKEGKKMVTTIATEKCNFF